MLDKPVCGTFSLSGKPLKYDKTTELELTKARALGECGTPDLLAKATPAISTHVVVKDASGSVADQFNIEEKGTKRGLGGILTFEMDDRGLVKISMKPSCTATNSYVVAR